MLPRPVAAVETVLGRPWMAAAVQEEESEARTPQRDKMLL
jgi:hypothetical protein